MIFFIRKLKLIYLIFKNALDPQPKYVFEMSNMAAQMASAKDIEILMNEVYGRHPQLETLRTNGKNKFETDLNKLFQMPDNTLGHIYAVHMLENKLDPEFYSHSHFSDPSIAGQKWEYFPYYSDKYRLLFIC